MLLILLLKENNQSIKKDMPNRNTHLPLGALAGFGISLFAARIRNENIGFSEIAAATLGGTLGGFVPDKIDLPIHPNHRSIGHGVFPVGIGVFETIKIVNNENFPSWLRYALYGFIAGYTIHLLVDATTPRSIPLLY